MIAFRIVVDPRPVCLEERIALICGCRVDLLAPIERPG